MPCHHISQKLKCNIHKLVFLHVEESGQFVEFEMTGCTTEPCEMLEGQSYTVSTTFIPGNKYLKDIKYYY